MKRLLLAASAVAALAACGETPQTLEHSKHDTAAFQGTGLPYVAPGWKPGDKTSWEQQLKTRTQQGQNEYAKTK